MELTDDSSLHNTENAKSTRKKATGVPFDSARGSEAGKRSALSKQQRAEKRKANIDAMLAKNSPEFLAEQSHKAIADGDLERMTVIEKYCKIVGAHSESEERAQNLNIKTEGKLDSTLSIQVGRVADERKG